MSDWVTVCAVGDLPDGDSKVVACGDKTIAVFRSGEQYFAVDDFCPHMGASLAGGYVEDAVVTCPLHAWRFRLTDGAWADNPRSTLRIGCYRVEVSGNLVRLEVPPSTDSK